MVELKNIKFIPKETKEARKVTRTLHRLIGSLDAPSESEKPLEFKKRMTIKKDPQPFKRKSWNMKEYKYYYVWREVDGRFAKRPEPGTRPNPKNVLKTRKNPFAKAVLRTTKPKD